MNKVSAIFAVVLIVFISGCSLENNPTNAGDPIVRFQNSELENLVRNELAIYSGDILYSALAGITDVSSYNYQGSLEGIEMLYNLTSVSFCDNSDIRDVTPLSRLKKLTQIKLNRNNNLENLESLASLPFLESLSLKHCGLTSVTFLKNFKKLKYLYLNENDVQSLEGIQGLGKLEYLYIGSNEVTSIAPIANLGKLREIHAGNNNISGVSFLVGSCDFKNEGYICLYGNPLSQEDLNVTIPKLERSGIEVDYGSVE